MIHEANGESDHEDDNWNYALVRADCVEISAMKEIVLGQKCN